MFPKHTSEQKYNVFGSVDTENTKEDNNMSGQLSVPGPESKCRRFFGKRNLTTGLTPRRRSPIDKASLYLKKLIERASHLFKEADQVSHSNVFEPGVGLCDWFCCSTQEMLYIAGSDLFFH